jgi:hypothetical protein
VNQMLQAPMYRGGHTYTDAPVPQLPLQAGTPPVPMQGQTPVLPQMGGGLPARQMLPEARQDTNVDQFQMVLPRAMMR